MDRLAWIMARTQTPRPDCILWITPTERGYGRIDLDGKSRRAHRVVWELTNGPIPGGLVVDHLCRIRCCVNVEHMELVTASEKVRRGWESDASEPERQLGRRRLSVGATCRRGHLIEAESDLCHWGRSTRCRTCAMDAQRKRRGSKPKQARSSPGG